jgi:RNA polymerase sigma-70 factor (ECF subfamily)
MRYHSRVPVGVQGVSFEIEEAVGRARAAWPLIAVDDARFAVRLVEIVSESPIATADLHVEDLYLAWACLEGNAEALATFEERMLPVIATTLARLRIEPGRRDDLLQDLRIHLIVGSAGGPGKLAQYRGRGELERWLRAIALRAAYRLASRSRSEVALDEMDMAGLGGVIDDPAVMQW